MEFLMTYGWAILVVLIVIGVMMYSGFVDVSGLLPEKCTFPISVNCLDYAVKTDSISLHLQNAAGKVMVVRNIKVTSEALAGPSDSDPGVCELKHSQRNHLMKKNSKQVFSVNVRSTAGFSATDPGGSFNDLNLLADGIMLVRAQPLSERLTTLLEANQTLNTARADYLEADDAYEDVIRAIDEINKTARDFANPKPAANKRVSDAISEHLRENKYRIKFGEQFIAFFEGNASEARDIDEISQKINDTGEYVIDVSNTSAWHVFDVAEGVSVDASNKYADGNNTVATQARNKASSFDDADERHFAMLVVGNATGETPLEVVKNAEDTAHSSSLRNAVVARAEEGSSSNSQVEILRDALEVFVYYKENFHWYTSRLLEYDHGYETRIAIADAVADHENTLGHKAAEFVQSASGKTSRPTAFRMANDARDGASVIKNAVAHLITEGNGVDAAVAAVDPDGTYSGITPSLEDVVSYYNTALAGNSARRVQDAVNYSADDVADTANRFSAKKLTYLLEEQLHVKFRYTTLTSGSIGNSGNNHPAAYALRDRIMWCVPYLDGSTSGHCTDDPDFEDYDDNTKIDEAFRFIESRTNELIEEFSGGRNEELVDAYLSAANATFVAATGSMFKVYDKYYYSDMDTLRQEAAGSFAAERQGTVGYAASNAVSSQIRSEYYKYAQARAKYLKFAGPVRTAVFRKEGVDVDRLVALVSGVGTVNDLVDAAERTREQHMADVTAAVNDITGFAAREVAKHEDGVSETVSVNKDDVINKINLHKDELDKFSTYEQRWGYKASTRLIEIVSGSYSENPEAVRQLFDEEFFYIELYANQARKRFSEAFDRASTDFDRAKRTYCSVCSDACDPAAACGAASSMSGLDDVGNAVEDGVEADDVVGDEGGEEGGTEEDAADEPSETFSSLTINSGDTTQLDVTNQDIPFQSVNFTVSNSVSNLNLTITTSSDLPSGIESPGVVPSSNGYINITSMPPSSFDNGDVSSVNVTFRVNKTFVSENGVSPGNVSLFRYDGGEWIELDTVHLPDLDIINADNYHYYEAKGTDDLLGVFAISLSRSISCVHREGVKGKNRYSIELVYSWRDSQSINHRITGELLANAP